ncbi:hypothetical protein KCU81_g561, partial [Aureobasidium melanogenum]
MQDALVLTSTQSMDNVVKINLYQAPGIQDLGTIAQLLKVMHVSTQDECYSCAPAAAQATAKVLLHQSIGRRIDAVLCSHECSECMMIFNVRIFDQNLAEPGRALISGGNRAMMSVGRILERCNLHDVCALCSRWHCSICRSARDFEVAASLAGLLNDFARKVISMEANDWLMTRSLMPWHTRRSAEISEGARRGRSISRHVSTSQNSSNDGLEQSIRPHVDRALANAVQTWELSTSPNSSREPEVLKDEVKKAGEGLLVNVVPERLLMPDSMVH